MYYRVTRIILWPLLPNYIGDTNRKQGQGNQCQTPGFKFEELTGWKKGKMGRNWKKLRNWRKNKTKGQNHDLPFDYFVDFFNPFDLFFFGEKMCFLEKIYVSVKTFFSWWKHGFPTFSTFPASLLFPLFPLYPLFPNFPTFPTFPISPTFPTLPALPVLLLFRASLWT